MCRTLEPLATYRQLRERGVTRVQLRASLTRGTLRHVRRGIYATTDACADAVRAAELGGVLACVSAARHLGLWVLADATPLHVSMRAHGHAQRSPVDASGGDTDGAPTVPSPDEPPPEILHWDGAPGGATSVPPVHCLLRQILRCRGVEDFFVALESALRQGRIDRAGMAWLRDRVGPAGREALSLARSDADSGLESLLRWRLRHLGLRIRTQVTIAGVGRVDVLVGDRLIIETDGREHHDGTENRHRDLMRDANAALWGYMTLRFDYAQIIHDWDLVEDAIRGAVLAGHS